MIVAFSDGWSASWYWNVPARMNVNVYVLPCVSTGEANEPPFATTW